MQMRVEDITDLAREHPSEARALLADRLVESLDPAEDGLIHELWAEETNRRLVELRSGQVIGIPGEEALAKLRTKYVG
jgi:hypothetical protein